MIRTWTRGTFRPGFEVFPVLEAFFFCVMSMCPSPVRFMLTVPCDFGLFDSPAALWGFKSGVTQDERRRNVCQESKRRWYAS